jgi:regulator of protease activity HflC (stomatin/prohibitin superfamily)
MGFVVIGALLIIVVVLFVYIASGVRIVRPYQRGVIEQLGRYKETVDPGLRLIYPFVQRIRTVDMREQVIDVPPQEVITQDNVTVSVDAVIYFEPTDPQRLLYNVGNFILAITKLAQTNLRNVVGEMSLDEAFTSRERVNAALRSILDDATDKWGVRVVRVEIQRIDPPADVMSAMHEQMRAERTRRAVVTEAEGARSAAITRAEGEKQSAILTAEGKREQDILNAEGEAKAVRTRAEAEQYRQQVVALGEAEAIRNVFEAIREAGADDRVIAIKYLEALQGIADGRATKIFIPSDMSALMGSLGGIAELFNGHGPADDSGGGGGTGRDDAARRDDAGQRAAEGSPPSPRQTANRSSLPSGGRNAPGGGSSRLQPPPPSGRSLPPSPSS